MTIKRKDIKNLYEIINRLKDKQFEITLQYKLIKIKRAIQEEIEIYQEQMYKNCLEFFELDENNNPIISDNGGYKIKNGQMNECNRVLNQLENIDISIPDIYFSLDELQALNLTMGELELFMPFIK